jgi:hypothetical protein
MDVVLSQNNGNQLIYNLCQMVKRRSCGKNLEKENKKLLLEKAQIVQNKSKSR